jgi:hypothetical protein
MQRAAIATLLMYAAASAQGQSPNPTPPPEIKKWAVWTGDWALSGMAKDRPDGPEYKVDWYLHEHWILGGFFMQVDQTWKGNGQELRSLELLSYDPFRKIHTSSGFSSDGSTWSLTATFDNATVIENGESRGPDGQLTRCQTTWMFSNDRLALSGRQECEQNGVRWRAIDVRGRKSRQPS